MRKKTYNSRFNDSSTTVKYVVLHQPLEASSIIAPITIYSLGALIRDDEIGATNVLIQKN
jgi:hypothetical protein